MKERNLVDLLINQANQYHRRTALRVKQEGRYQDISWDEFLEQTVRISQALRLSGIQKGDRVAIYSENRPQWAFADLAILALGAVVVPVYPTASLREVEHVLTHSETSLIFVSTAEKLDSLSQLGNKIRPFKRVVVFDVSFKGNGAIVSLAEFVASVLDSKEALNRFKNDAAEVGLDDLATLIYTSGTTGLPKGVMLTHRNFLINCYDAREALPITDEDVSLSFLPLSHVFERMGGYYLHLLCGITIAYAENMNTVPENLKEVRPTIACAVPRFFEKMYARIQEEVNKGSAVKRAIFNWTLRVGKETSQFRMKKKPMPFFLKCQYVLAERLVYRKIYEKLGGRLRCFISGSAPLARELAEFFYSVGILILEGYGLTETSPVISVNRWDRFQFGSVGLPLKHVETKLAPDGEIIVRGPSVMQGYYRNPEATREAIRDGWFYTGDFGKVDSDGFLYITGRKKDLIKTSGGKFVSPQNIESLLSAEPTVSQIVVMGDKQRFITALIVPNFERLKSILEPESGEVAIKPADWVQDPRVHELLRSRIEARTQELASFEKIKCFTLLAKEFSQSAEELTTTLKIKRNAVAEHFKDTIERMYRETENQDEGRNRLFYVL